MVTGCAFQRMDKFMAKLFCGFILFTILKRAAVLTRSATVNNSHQNYYKDRTVARLQNVYNCCCIFLTLSSNFSEERSSRILSTFIGKQNGVSCCGKVITTFDC